MARLEWAVGAVAVLAAACSSTNLQNGTLPDAGEEDAAGDATTTNEAGTTTDAGVPETGSGDEGTVATACTAPPYVTFTATLATVSGGAGAPPDVSAVKVGFSSCSGFAVTSGDGGVATTQLTQFVKTSPFYFASGAIDTIGAELSASSNVETSPLLLSTSQIADVPTIADGGSDPTILIALAPGGSAPCNQIAGVKLAVTGHPEAQIFYMDPTWPAKAAPTAGTSATGPYAFIGGLALDAGTSSVVVTGTSPVKTDGGTCSVSLTTGGQTGSFALVPSSITFGAAVVSN